MSEPVAPLANVDGNLQPLAEVRASVLDRGFLFGDAVYEVLRVYAGRPWLEEEHFTRLGNSLAAIRIGGVDLCRLRARVRETIAAGPFGEALVYIHVTRGAAPARRHGFPDGVAPLELLWVSAYSDVEMAEARRAGTSVVLRPDIRWGRCDIKSTNLLANVLALQSAQEAGCSEALLYLPDGSLTEGTHSSLFGVLDGALVTAPNGPDILPGCTRGLLFRLAAKLGVPVQERMLHRDELPRVAELFLSGTASEVLPVVRVDGTPVGGGHPGPVTRGLQRAYQAAVREFLGA
jgi:D-alanine transaminase